MIVCHCNAVTDRDVHCAIAGGACDLRDIGRACAAGTNCGGCHPLLERLLDDAERRLVRAS